MCLEILVNAGCGVRSGFLIDKIFIQLALLRFVGLFGKREIIFAFKKKGHKSYHHYMPCMFAYFLLGRIV
jgi:hypothetical protein